MSLLEYKWKVYFKELKNFIQFLFSSNNLVMFWKLMLDESTEWIKGERKVVATFKGIIHDGEIFYMKFYHRLQLVPEPSRLNNNRWRWLSGTNENWFKRIAVVKILKIELRNLVGFQRFFFSFLLALWLKQYLWILQAVGLCRL